MDFSSLTSLQLGHYGEMLAASYYEGQGYTVSESSPYYGDLKLTSPDGEVTFIEVKTIRPNKDGRVRATVRKEGSQHLVHAQIVHVFVAVSPTELVAYQIPAVEITATKINLAQYAANIL